MENKTVHLMITNLLSFSLSLSLFFFKDIFFPRFILKTVTGYCQNISQLSQGKGWSHPGQVNSSPQGHIEINNHSLSHTHHGHSRFLNSHHMHAFGLCEEAREPRKWSKNIQKLFQFLESNYSRNCCGPTFDILKAQNVPELDHPFLFKVRFG